MSGTDCIDYRILQKIGLPKRKTEQRIFPNMTSWIFPCKYNIGISLGEKS